MYSARLRRGARLATRLAILACGLGIMTEMAVAQSPSQAQTNAIRSQCRSDFIANCSGVTPGGRDALMCLNKNSARLSAGCRTAVNAVMPKAPPPAAKPAAAKPAQAKPAPAASANAPASDAAPAPEQIKQVQAACAADFKKSCRGVKPGGEDALACLNKNAATLSDACWGAVSALNPQDGQPPADSAPPAADAQPTEAPAAAAAPAGEAPAAGGPSPDQVKALQSACAADFKKSCRGVKPGGEEALACLNKNAATLSDACWGAVSAATPGEGAPPANAAPAKQGSTKSAPPPRAAAPRAAPPPRAAVAPPPPPPFVLPPLSLRVGAFVVRTCEVDRATVCAGVPMGGGRVLQCLARNIDRVSRRCRIALERAASM